MHIDLSTFVLLLLQYPGFFLCLFCDLGIQSHKFCDVALLVQGDGEVEANGGEDVRDKYAGLWT